ncbi:hypothetical protein [Nesterenkonia lutea]|uniref:DUF805 domain-containing protein n=1 Tax=Nesterenkonia lutea TaxID=272919 RepID=A0ABR9JAP7_9MICC|nr:hypothetical protein [Nesterenkonia lutea]MBE1522998.1 hypothetical protein [Nesterenkonia lutea]
MFIVGLLSTTMAVNPTLPNAWETLGRGFFVVVPLVILALVLWAVVLVMRTPTLDVTAKGVLLLLALLAPVIGPILVLLLCRQSRREGQHRAHN